MHTPLIAGLAFLAFAHAAEASAWTLDRGDVQVFSGATASRATQKFDSSGTPVGKVVFNKLLVQNWAEYGLTDAVTLFAAPEYVVAETDLNHRGVVSVRSASVEAGARILLLTHIGMLAVQTSGMSAGAFHMSTAAGEEAGQQFELRLLYGRSFKALDRDAFFDMEAAQRWVSRPRPDEWNIDMTAGLWLTKDTLVMLQTFNMISGDATGACEGYRLHKLQASLVERITSRWSVQGGYFFAPAGRNIVKEQGLVMTIWYQS